MDKIHDILHFWFEETSSKQKYMKDEAFDARIKDEYEDTYWELVRSRGTEWRKTPKGSLAAIVVLDQFSRNMFRGDPQSFAADDLALEIAGEMGASGTDKEITAERRGAIYMPYMHSESKEVHARALSIFERHAQETGEMSGLEYEKKHKAIIDRFGRYPHRNKVLGRTSTLEEEEFNKEHRGF